MIMASERSFSIVFIVIYGFSVSDALTFRNVMSLEMFWVQPGKQSALL